MRFFMLGLLALFQVCLNAQASPSILYVGNANSSSVSVIDLSTLSVIATVSIGTNARPIEITLNPDASRLYTANFNAGNISIVDTSNLTVIGTITVLTQLIDVAFNPDATELWTVRNNANGFVYVIDPVTNDITHTITVGKNPFQVIFKTTEKIAYVTNSISSNISVVDTTNKTIVATISLDQCQVRHGVFTLDEDYFYCTDFVGAFPAPPMGVRRVNTNTLTEVQAIPTPGNGITDGITLTNDGKFVYVSPSQPGTRFFSAINVATNTIDATISSGGANAIITDPISGLLYTSLSAVVGIIDPNTNEFITTITVGVGPVGLAIASNASPFSVTAQSKSDLFLTQIDRYNKITWENPSNISVAQFEIYRDASLTDLVATVPSNITEYLDHNVKKNTAYTYYVAGRGIAGLVLITGNAVVITD